jgi:VWFA-related protein
VTPPTALRLPCGAFVGVAMVAIASAVVSSSGGAASQATLHRDQRPGGPPPVSYAVDVSLVEVDAVVTDGGGQVIRDLRQDEFRIFEDGTPQTIDRLSFVNIPIARADAAPTGTVFRTSDVRSNVQPFAGRLYVLLLDDLNTSSLRGGRVKAAAREFVEQRLSPGDLAAVVHASGSRDNQDFTDDRTRLLASIDRFAGRMPRSETLNRVDEYNRQLLLTGRIPERVVDPDEPSRAEDARRVFDVIGAIARRVAPVHGRRKALIWFGEGVAYDMFNVARSQASEVLESSRAAVAAASRANVAIYGVDPRGLRGLGEETMQLTSPVDDPTKPLGATGLSQELFRSQQNLRGVSNETGGFAAINAGEFAHAFERIVEENSEYYLLGYYPTTPRQDQIFRRLEVRVDRPGAVVRARSGYIALPPKVDSNRAGTGSDAPAALRDALLSAVPVSGVPLTAHAAAFKGTGDKASVLVTVEYAASAFSGAPNGSADGDRLVVSAIAVEPGGKVEASDQSTITLTVKPETRDAMRARGFRTHSRLELPPGRYQIRVAALVANTGVVGSVHEDIDVPDFAKSPLALSGVVMTSVAAGFTPTARVDERMRDVLPAPPTTLREFSNEGAVALFAEVYERGSVPKQDVTVAARIRDRAGQIVFEREDLRTAAELKRSKGGYSLQISLRRLTPGEYVLELAARSGEAGPNAAAREIAFRVREAAPSTTSVPATPPPPAESIPSLPVVAIAKGALSSVSEPREVVARNRSEWDALWSSVSRRLAAPVVAFDDTMIVGVFLGSRPTAGYEPEIVRVVREGDVLVVEWRERVPPDAGNPPAETTPFVVAGVPQHAGEVRFRKIQG